MENEKITLNDKEYEVKDLSDTAKYCLSQINSIEQKLRNLNFEADQLNASKNHFIGVLSTEVEKKKE